MRLVLLMMFTLIGGNCFAIPAGQRNSGRELSTTTLLIGHWHSISLSGDAIGLAVDDVVVYFDEDKSFKATVNMNLGGPTIIQGTFTAKLNQLTLHSESNGVIKCAVNFDGPKHVIIKPKAKAVTAKFSRGSAPESSGGLF